MLSFTSKTTTLLAYLTLVLSIVSAVDGLEVPRHNHVELKKRFIKKRAPQFDVPPIGVAPIPSDEPSVSESLSSILPSETGLLSLSVSASETPSASVSAESSLVSSSVSESSSSEVSSSSSSSTVSSTRVVTTSSTPPPERSTVTRAAQTRTMTASAEQQEETNDVAPPSMAGASQEAQNKSNILTILIAVVASIGGVFILWTVFRKWKLGSSKRFDKRMQPIDWEKPSADDDIIPANRRLSAASQRSNIRANAGFGQDLSHDFTAGPSHLSPVGGYADMSRGSSPIPQFTNPTHGHGHGGRY